MAYYIHVKKKKKKGLSQVHQGTTSVLSPCVCLLFAPAGGAQCGVHVMGGSGFVSLFVPPGKRKALKLNFANPTVKPTSRLPLNPTPSFQNPHM